MTSAKISLLRLSCGAVSFVVFLVNINDWMISKEKEEKSLVGAGRTCYIFNVGKVLIQVADKNKDNQINYQVILSWSTKFS